MSRKYPIKPEGDYTRPDPPPPPPRLPEPPRTIYISDCGDNKNTCKGCGGTGYVDADVGQVFECKMCEPVKPIDPNKKPSLASFVGSFSKVDKAQGHHLTLFGNLYSIKRRWFGLEPDFMFRKRLIKFIQNMHKK